MPVGPVDSGQRVPKEVARRLRGVAEVREVRAHSGRRLRDAHTDGHRTPLRRLRRGHGHRRHRPSPRPPPLRSVRGGGGVREGEGEDGLETKSGSTGTVARVACGAADWRRSLPRRQRGPT